jgi:uncharacterized RDD family membrane protein YckC
MDYHLTIAGERSGPFSQFSLIDKIREGKLKGDELVWHRGLTGWVPLRELEEFTSYWPITEEQKANAEAARTVARTELDYPQPWMRFWARLIDYLWFGILVWSLITTFLPQETVKWIVKVALMGVPLNSLVYLLYVPLEAWMLSTKGTTPGKSLLQVQVRNLKGGLPTFDQALVRSFQVWLKGVAMWLPLVSLFAMTWWRVRLMQKGTTSWDEACETKVEHGEPAFWRYTLLGSIILIMLAGLVFTMIMSKDLLEAMQNLPK